MSEKKHRIEFGDWQTPVDLAMLVCDRLRSLGTNPSVIIEPTCGVGAFVKASARSFPNATTIVGHEINSAYLERLGTQLTDIPKPERVKLEVADFFAKDWNAGLGSFEGELLVIGNPPWVTSAGLGAIGGTNLPGKSNFQGHSGFDAMTGKANFDISEYMMIEMLRWFRGRSGTLAMLCKTAVARKVLAHAQKQRAFVHGSFMVCIDTKKHFDASVESCLLVMRFTETAEVIDYDYIIYNGFDDQHGTHVGYRSGLLVRDVDAFDRTSRFIGRSPQKWRSGVKHDAASIMEFERKDGLFVNGLGESVELESEFMFPLMKGSDVANGERAWRERFVLVTQKAIGESTDAIRRSAPLTWAYLESKRAQLDRRGSRIYQDGPSFSVFGVGEYAFRPWRIAICGLYKSLRFRLVGPIEDKPVIFDDTVYYVSFDTEEQARTTLDSITTPDALSLYDSLIFWDEKRPIKTSILNIIDWSRSREQTALFA